MSDTTALGPVSDSTDALSAATDPSTLLPTSSVVHSDPSSLSGTALSDHVTDAHDAVTSAVGTAADSLADAGDAVVAAIQPTVDALGHVTGAAATTAQPVTDTLDAAAQPVVDTTAQAAGAIAGTAQPLVDAVANAGQPVVQTLDAAAQLTADATAQAAAAAQPLVEAAAGATEPVVESVEVTAQPLLDVGSHVATTVETVAQTVAAAAQPVMTTVGDATQRVADQTAQASGAVAAAAQRLVDTIANADSLTAPIGATTHQLASTVGAAAQPALEGSAHAGTVVASTVESGAGAAVSAVGSGGLDFDLPPLDPAYLRYLGLAGAISLTMQAAARWANAAGGCGIPTRLALRQFRLLPCVAFSSAERLTNAALAVTSAPGTISGWGGRSVSPTPAPAGRATNGAPGLDGATAAQPGSSSGAIHMAQILLLTALVALNGLLLAIRNAVRREHGA